MQAVILAAGCGLRLRPMTDNTPKGLIELKGRTLLEYSLESLRNKGIEEVVIAVGYLADKIQERFGSQYKDMPVTYVLNPAFAYSGSMYSFYCARKAIRGDVLLLESDLVYDHSALDAVMGCGYKDCILVAEASGSNDEVFVCCDSDNRVTALGKHLGPEQRKNACGELVGISRLSPDFLGKLFNLAAGDFSSGRMMDHYEETLLRCSSAEHPLFCRKASGLLWSEIDKQEDLTRAGYVLQKVGNDER